MLMVDPDSSNVGDSGLKQRNKWLIAAASILLLAIAARSCNMVALANNYSEVDVSLGARSLHIRPAAEVENAGSKLGVPRYEMKDTFFINVSYACDSEIDGTVEVVKDGSVVPASDVYPSGGRCYMNFVSSSPMSGVFTIRMTSSDGYYERLVSLQRGLSFMSPVWERINSA
jgi:hypothetical protein